MRSLDRDALVSLLCDLTDRPALEASGIISVVTQYPASASERPDLVVLLEDRPWVAFENKVAHHVGTQLDRYGDWLASIEECTPWRGLVFVTHATPPPPDFDRATWDRRYDGRIATGVIHWGRLGRRLLALTMSSGEASVPHTLAKSFYTMLESRQMADEFPNSQAFAALELFLGHASPIENLIARMWEQVCHAANSNKIGARELGAEPDFGCYSASRFVQPAPANTSGWSFLETGIWHADLARWWSAPQLGYAARGTHVFVLFANDEDKKLFDGIEGAPTGWLRPERQFFVHKSLLDFPADIDSQATAVLAWCRAKADELREFLVSQQMTVFAR